MKFKMSKQSKKHGRMVSYVYRLVYRLNPSFERYEKLVEGGHVLRPHYAYALVSTAKEAVKLGYRKISILEFGCAGGSGLVDLEYIGNQISEVLKIEFEIYGFDAGTGLPQSNDYRDCLYMWSAGEYSMDRVKLEKYLNTTRLIIGDTKDTVPEFIKEKAHATIGAVFIDVDYYTSTKSCLNIFNYSDNNYLPRVFVYLDDTLLTSESTGELLAVNEYNEYNEYNKNISVDTLLAEKMSLKWRNWIYLGKKFYHWHNFNHKEYSTPIIGNDKELKL
ncbi:hypothetical protein HOO14_06490 [bacterium]|nr:hypothetical protein [bacterium]